MSRPRGRRREAIADAAADLFAERGFPATGIDEIGAASGISGPAVYRHYAGKTEILGAVVEHALTIVLAGMRVARLGDPSPTELLARLAENMCRNVLADTASWTVVVRERKHLDGVTASHFRQAHLDHVDAWDAALTELRPELSREQRLVLVHGVLGLVAPYAARADPELTDERVLRVLCDAAARVLAG